MTSTAVRNGSLITGGGANGGVESNGCLDGPYRLLLVTRYREAKHLPLLKKSCDADARKHSGDDVNVAPGHITLPDLSLSLTHDDPPIIFAFYYLFGREWRSRRCPAGTILHRKRPGKCIRPTKPLNTAGVTLHSHNCRHLATVKTRANPDYGSGIRTGPQQR